VISPSIWRENGTFEATTSVGLDREQFGAEIYFMAEANEDFSTGY
jgi:hypothetical protein